MNREKILQQKSEHINELLEVVKPFRDLEESIDRGETIFNKFYYFIKPIELWDMLGDYEQRKLMDDCDGKIGRLDIINYIQDFLEYEIEYACLDYKEYSLTKTT